VKRTSTQYNFSVGALKLPLECCTCTTETLPIVISKLLSKPLLKNVELIHFSILFTENGTLKIGDFDHSRSVDNAAMNMDSYHVGTRRWKAPEVLKENKYKTSVSAVGRFLLLSSSSRLTFGVLASFCGSC
jgi:hypothetical protein